MTAPGHDTGQVRAHYASLAGRYDDKANKACKRAYQDLLQRTLGGCRRVLESGAGSSPLLGALNAPFAVACDLSLPMLAQRNAVPEVPRLAADGQQLPVADGAFDGVFSINVLEHVPDPARFVAESARILARGGLLLAVTPNGDGVWLLDLLQRLHLKLSDGPHCLLSARDLAALAGEAFEIVEHRKFLAFPAGPPSLVAWVDRVGNPARGRGLFQFILLRRR